MMIVRMLMLCGCVLVIGLTIRAAARDVDGEQNNDIPQKVIVLHSGKVITGDIEDRPGGYLVDNAVGKVVIPFTQVRLTAVNLPEAYRKLKASITEPTASAHIALGQWCYDNRLYTSAREQVKAALILEPERKEARSLLIKLERIAVGDNVEALIPSAPPKTRDGFQKAEATSLAGLSAGVTQDYVRRVQPLLMNKCGNARCHGAGGTSEFRLTPVRLGMSGFRALTDQNLSVVLRQIDSHQPEASALLIVPQGKHGGGRAIWSGPRAEEQLAELRSWVTRVALDQSRIVMTSAEATGPASKVSAQPGERDPFLREILDEERQDRFDPKIFNRLMHGRD